MGDKPLQQYVGCPAEPQHPDDSPALSAEQIRSIIDELISERLASLCKQYCYSNRKQYQCTIDHAWGNRDIDSLLCDWGNAAYVWFVEELTSHRRLAKIAGAGVSSVEKYFSKIIYSNIFLEQFKNWRFQRRIRVPEYIKALDRDAHKVFWYLCDRDTVPNMAQRLNRRETEIAQIVRDIDKALHDRGRGHLLDLKHIVPLSTLDISEDEVPDYQWSGTAMDELEQRGRVHQAYFRLNWLEQFVIDAMIVDKLNAKAVLSSLVAQGVSVDERVAPDDLNVQHIYYFLRKSLDKLRQNTV